MELKVEGQKLLEKFNKPQGFDKLAQVQHNVDSARVEMQQNVNKLVTNQEDLNLLEDQTKGLKENATKFESNAKGLEREMFWRKVKYTAIIIGVVIAIVVIIVLAVVLSRK